MYSRQERFRSWIPHGFDYLTPAGTEKQLLLKDRVRKQFRAAGYAEITPPAIDFAPTFSLTARSDSPSPVFSMRAGEGELLAVRSDLTVQVIKAVANRRLGEGFPVRFSYIQPVFQDRPWGSGHKREFLQAGVELIGEHGDNRVGELLDLARRCLEFCKEKPRILYGDARFVGRLLELAPEASRSELSLAFYNKDSANIAAICKARGVDAEVARIAAEVPLTFGGPEAMERLLDICRHRPRLLEILEEGRRHADVIYDFSLVRELSYYTGPVFEAYLPGSGEQIFTGGVYDDLYAEFGGEHRTACGFALNLSILVDNDL